MRHLIASETETPIGRLRIVHDEDCLYGLSLPRGWPELRGYLERRFGELSFRSSSGTVKISQELDAYFDGDLEALQRIKVDPGGSAFQSRVWKELRRIRAGRTRSYSELAQSIGRLTAVRAVAHANARNPIAVVIPCHRVIHADG